MKSWCHCFYHLLFLLSLLDGTFSTKTFVLVSSSTWEPPKLKFNCVAVSLLIVIFSPRTPEALTQAIYPHRESCPQSSHRHWGQCCSWTSPYSSYDCRNATKSSGKKTYASRTGGCTHPQQPHSNSGRERGRENGPGTLSSLGFEGGVSRISWVYSLLAI